MLGPRPWTAARVSTALVCNVSIRGTFWSPSNSSAASTPPCGGSASGSGSALLPAGGAAMAAAGAEAASSASSVPSKLNELQAAKRRKGWVNEKQNEGGGRSDI